MHMTFVRVRIMMTKHASMFLLSFRNKLNNKSCFGVFFHLQSQLNFNA